MTVDPMFAFNSDLPDLSNNHQARAKYICPQGPDTKPEDHEVLITLSDGREIRAPTLIRDLTLVSPDFDNNGSIDFDDFLAFGAAFGKPEPAFDLTGDGKVDFHDFLSFVQAFKE